MKRKALWKFLLFLGLCPFAAPLLLWLCQFLSSPWPLFDWLVLYSFLYWPTYVAGLALILLALWKRKKINSLPGQSFK